MASLTDRLEQNKEPIPKSEYSTQVLTFEPRNTPIDYFKLTNELLEHGEIFNVNVHELDLGDERYLDIGSQFENFDYNANETVIFNFQTGLGKSSTFYELIQQYAEAGFYVIVCSPFKKLIEKDYAALRSGKHIFENDAFDYTQLGNDEGISDDDYQLILSKRIHVMTINCLLQNPGDSFQDQSLVKRTYLKKLRHHITDQNKKVIFFFDEIHASIKNFKSRFIPHLLSWKDLTHKCFVASATFTYACLPVIQHISFLTEGNITVYQAPRKRMNPLARLHLHLTSDVYYNEHLSPLSHLNFLIEKYTKAKRKINILTGYRTLALGLTDRKNKSSLPERILKLSPNMLTSSTPNNKFDRDRNNIGTNFTTGVDLDDENAVLIIIFPAISNKMQAHYGAFSDGIHSIVQSISRVRKGGDIHLFMLAPEVIIDLNSHKSNLSKVLYSDTEDASYQTINETYSDLLEAEEIRQVRSEESTNWIKEFQVDQAKLGVYEYTLANYMMDYSTDHVRNKYACMGKGISPYVLWAAINNQFCNSELQTITYHTKHKKVITISKENQIIQYLELLPVQHILHIKGTSFRNAISILPSYLENSTEFKKDKKGTVEEIQYVNQFSVNGKLKNIGQLKNTPTFMRLLIQLIYKIKNEQDKEIEKDDYIRTCIHNAITFSNTNSTPELIALYQKLSAIKTMFIEFVASQTKYNGSEAVIHKDYGLNLPDDLYRNAISVFNALKREDDILAKSFSLFQKTDTPSKQSVASELEIFTNITGIQKNHNGEIKKYYLVNDPVSNDDYLQNMNFLV